MPKTKTINQEYQELVARAHGVEMPPHPAPDKKGRRSAVEFGKASIAREVTTRRIEAGWTQEQLARNAGVRAETVCRIEGAKHHPQQATLAKIEQALAKVEGR